MVSNIIGSVCLLGKPFNNNYLGGLLISIVAALTSISNSITHSLPFEIHTLQILFLKAALSCIVLLLLKVDNLKFVLQTSQLKWHFLKGLCGFTGSLFLIAALKMHKLSLSECSALSLSSAIMTTIGAHFFFKEKINRFVVMAVTIGFLGVLLVLHPSRHILSFDSLFPILSAIAFSASVLLAKKITIRDSIITTTLYLLFFMAVLSMPLALYFWVSLDVLTWIKITVISLVYLMAQWCLIKAYATAAAGFIAPFKFVRFPVAVILGILFFGEIPTVYSIIGACMIIVSCVIIDGAKAMKSYANHVALSK